MTLVTGSSDCTARIWQVGSVAGRGHFSCASVADNTPRGRFTATQR